MAGSREEKQFIFLASSDIDQLNPFSARARVHLYQII